jgi:hypothetical protein
MNGEIEQINKEIDKMIMRIFGLEYEKLFSQVCQDD